MIKIKIHLKFFIGSTNMNWEPSCATWGNQSWIHLSPWPWVIRLAVNRTWIWWLQASALETSIKHILHQVTIYRKRVCGLSKWPFSHLPSPVALFPYVFPFLSIWRSQVQTQKSKHSGSIWRPRSLTAWGFRGIRMPCKLLCGLLGLHSYFCEVSRALRCHLAF